MSKQILLPSEIASRRSAKFPRGETMTIDEVAEVVGPEFKEMNENPPPEVVKVMEEMQKKGGSAVSAMAKKILDAMHALKGRSFGDNELWVMVGDGKSRHSREYLIAIEGLLDHDMIRFDEDDNFILGPGSSGPWLGKIKSAGADLLPSERVALGNKKARYVVSPGQIISRAVMNGLLSPEEAKTREVRESAQNEAERLAESWPEGEGFGSSDMTYTVQNMLNNAGLKADFVGGGRLQRLDKVASQKLKARFHEGPKGEKEFQAWMKKQPKETQEDWAKYTEENKDKFKTAYLEPSQGEAVKHFLSHILAALRAQYLSYQTSHWQSKGPTYYGNHLLFQRLYGSVQIEIDAVGEKLVGYTGIDSVNLPAQIELIEAYCSRWCQIECLHERGLQSEKDMQKLFKATYDNLKAQGSLPLGLDDFLMATASAHETNAYLLQQVLA